jgi:hypothetical protein
MTSFVDEFGPTGDSRDYRRALHSRRDAEEGGVARVVVTGSSTGLGPMAARPLVEQRHRAILHGRDAARADDARRAPPEAEAEAAGDLASIAETRKLADLAWRRRPWQGAEAYAKGEFHDVPLAFGVAPAP